MTDADRLGDFAARWYQDKRAASRKLLLEYLNRPLNAFRHEVLVKRLFKLAEQAADDEAMGRFLVLFDRAVRRVRKKRQQYDSRSRTSWTEEWLRVPAGTAMPRPRWVRGQRGPRAAGPMPAPSAPERYRLFSVHTRNYLRRRAWRYFRKLGKQHPDRYVPAISAALGLYTDADASSGLALIDNWGLMHALFHHCPALAARPHGWTVADGHALSAAPAPIYEPLWKAVPRALIDLLKQARCRPVRQWVIRLLRRDHATVLAGLPLVELLGLLAHEDAEVVALAAEALRGAVGLDTVSLERWLALLETPNVEVLDILCELMATHLRPDGVTFEQAVRLAGSRPLPVARLGFTWLKAKAPQSEADGRALLGLTEAQAELLRPRWCAGCAACSARRRTSTSSGSWNTWTAGTPTSAPRAGHGCKTSPGRATTWTCGGASWNRPTMTSGWP